MKLSLILVASMAMTLQFCDKKGKASEQTSEVKQVTQNDTFQTNKVKDNRRKKIKPTKVKFSGKKLHPEKQFCVTYQHKGMGMNGTSTNCSRKYGQESYTIEDMNIGMGGFSQSQKRHSIILKDKVFNTDLVTGMETVTTNPMYGPLSKADPQDLNKQILAAMQMAKTTETRTFDGVLCHVYNSAQMGSACFTPNMVMLWQSIMGMEQTAIKVDIGSAGDAAKYVPPKNAKQAPNVDDILKQMGQ